MREKSALVFRGSRVVLAWILFAWGMEIPKLGQIIDSIVAYEAESA